MPKGTELSVDALAMRIACLVLAATLTAGTTACGLFRKATPRVLPVRAMRDVVPVVELSSTESLLGRCVSFRPDGTLRFEACPKAISPLFRSATSITFDSGKHELEVLWVGRDADLPGFSGSGGHFYAHESHIQEVRSIDLATTRLTSSELEAIDAVCRARVPKNEGVLVTRAFGGCAVAHRGVARPGSATAGGGGGVPRVELEELERSGERLGLPRGFETTGDDAPPGCDGDPIGLAVSVTPLPVVCRNFVQQEMRISLEVRMGKEEGHVRELSARLEVARAKSSELRSKVEERTEKLRAEAAAAAVRPVSKRGKGKRAPPQKASLPVAEPSPREKRQLFQLRREEGELLEQLARARKLASNTARLIGYYRGDPYTDSSAQALSVAGTNSP